MTKTAKQPYSILYAEDEQETRDNYLNYLNRHYETVYEARDGVEAYSIYQTKKPHILILDINMPRMNGLELLEKIRESDHTTKCLIMTAHTDQEFLLQATKMKLTDYLLKPLKRNELKDALTSVIDELENYETLSKKMLILGDGYSWNTRESTLHLNGLTITLSSLETKLSKLFFDNINIELSHHNIINYIWDISDEPKTDALKTLIKKLRKKLPKDIIQNIYSIGYKAII